MKCVNGLLGFHYTQSVKVLCFENYVNHVTNGVWYVIGNSNSAIGGFPTRNRWWWGDGLQWRGRCSQETQQDGRWETASKLCLEWKILSVDQPGVRVPFRIRMTTKLYINMQVHPSHPLPYFSSFPYSVFFCL